MKTLKIKVDKHSIIDLKEFIHYSLDILSNQLLDLLVKDKLHKLYNKLVIKSNSRNPKVLSLNLLEIGCIKHVYHWYSTGQEITELPGLLQIIQEIEKKEI